MYGILCIFQEKKPDPSRKIDNNGKVYVRYIGAVLHSEFSSLSLH